MFHCKMSNIFLMYNVWLNFSKLFTMTKFIMNLQIIRHCKKITFQVGPLMMMQKLLKKKLMAMKYFIIEWYSAPICNPCPNLQSLSRFKIPLALICNLCPDLISLPRFVIILLPCSPGKFFPLFRFFSFWYWNLNRKNF